MKYLQLSFFITLISTSASAVGQSALDVFVQDFSYESRKEMKISSERIVELLQQKEAVLVDIRFEEEQTAWQMDFALEMPLSTLPRRYKELPKNRLIVTACPHKDRAIIAMVYLKSKGYEVAYLKDGLLGLAEYLRGEKAKHFIESFER